MIGKFLKNNWAVTVIGGVFSVLVLRLIDTFLIDDFLWDGIKNGLNAVVDFFGTEYSVKLYFLILLPILFVAAIIGITYLFSLRGNKSSFSPYPEWKDYNKDVFGDLQYRWQYDFIGRRYEIMNLQRYCNKCSCLLVDNRCPVCRTNYSYGHQYPSGQEVMALIVHRIDTGLYKDSPYYNA